MTHPFRLLAALLLGWHALPAQTATAPPTTRPMLWRIERGRPAWLLGTIHMADRRVTVLPPAVVSAVEQCDSVYTEVRFSDDEMNTALRRQLLPREHKLDGQLPDAVRTALATFLERNGQNAASMQRLKPWAAWMRVTSLEKPIHPVGPRIMDLELLQLARDEDKRTDCLETIDEQMAVFDGIPAAEQVALLQSAMEMVDRIHRQGGRLLEDQLATYLAGDEHANLQWFRTHLGPPAAQRELIDAMTRRMLTERNERMAARMLKVLEQRPQESPLFAMGVYHLGGDRGVLALLRERGFRVERVVPEPASAKPAVAPAPADPARR